MAIVATVETITKEIAQEYLKHNTNNYRFVSRLKVNSYAEDMKAGLWEENGEPIVFGADGTLKDGQHRLLAIVESGIPCKMLVVRGVEDNVQIYDMGMGRTISQIAKASGYYAGTDMIGAARILVGGFHKASPKGIVQQYIENHHDELHQSSLIAKRGSTHPIGKKAGICLAVYVCRRLNLVNDDILEDFFYVFNSGTIKTNQFRDPSPALIASRTIITKLKEGSSSTCRKQFITIMQALLDFKKNKNRKVEYKTDIEMPMLMLNHLRQIDGFEETNG